MKLRLLFVPLVGLLSACGGNGSPTNPTVPTPPPAPVNGMVLTFVSADLDVGITDATMNVAGNSRTTDANGQVTFDQALPPGMPYTSVAPGYLERVSVIRGDTRLPLVPARTRLYDEAFYRDIVFNQFMPGRRLSRPAQNHVFLHVSPEIANDPEALVAQQEAAALATRAVSERIQFAVITDAPTAGALVYDVSIRSTCPASGATGSSFSGNLMVGGYICYSNITNARLLRGVLHEKGHILGLGHPTGQVALMNPSPPAALRDFTDAEKLVLYIASRQLAGTEYPHNDRNAQVTSSSGVHLSIVEDEAMSTENFVEYVIQFENGSSDILRNLTVKARLEGNLYNKTEVDAMGTVRVSQRDTSVIWSGEGVTELQALSPKVVGAVRMRVARPQVSGESYGRISVDLLGSDGKPITTDASIVTIACNQ